VNPANGGKSKWSTEEDEKLMEAVQKLGKDWVAVAMLVPGRTNNQCRSRWLNALDPANDGGKGKWSPQEDGKLAEAVQKHGKDCWVKVPAMVSSRTRNQCHQRCSTKLDPANGKNLGKWTPAEDVKLKKAVKKHDNNWVAISCCDGSRSNELSVP
jgi:hypothetical protein